MSTYNNNGSNRDFSFKHRGQSHTNPSFVQPAQNFVTSTKYMPSDNHMEPPAGVPMFPLYGYDNAEDFDKDISYMKTLYPVSLKSVLKEVNKVCDKLDYHGSFMYDEYPDKVTLERIIDDIYDTTNPRLTDQEVRATRLHDKAPQPNPKEQLKSIIKILLLNEMLDRRRKYRCNKRWY